MSEENNKKEKHNKQKNKIDKTSIIFFVIIIIALITFTVILIVQSSKTIYITNFGKEMSSTIKINSDYTKIDITIDVKGTTSTQHGKLKNISKDDSIKVFEAELAVADDITETVEIIIDGTELKLKYDDGTEIIYKEKK